MITVINTIIPFKGYKAMTIWPFIFIRKGKTYTDIDNNHERIHAEQQLELLLVGFLILYLLFFIVGLIRYRSWDKAYRNNPFEVEAYFWQSDLDYLNHRRHYAWCRKS